MTYGLLVPVSLAMYTGSQAHGCCRAEHVNHYTCTAWKELLQLSFTGTGARTTHHACRSCFLTCWQSFRGLGACKVLSSACSSSIHMWSGTPPGWTGRRERRALTVCSHCRPLKSARRLARPSHLGLRQAFHSPRWQRKVHWSLYGLQSNL